MMSWQSFGPSFGGPSVLGLGGLFLILVLVWSLVWKGLALWKAARAGSRNWFVALLILNTIGILEILYLFVFSKKPALPTSSDNPQNPQ